MAAHSVGTRAIPPVPNDQPPPAWDQWLRDMAQSLNLISLWVGTASGPSYQAGSGIAIDNSTTPPTISTAVPYLPIAGGTLTGFLTLVGNPTANLHAATKLYVDTADALKAPLASPVFTGVPLAPTPATGDNSTALATTAFVKGQGYVIGGSYLPLSGGTLTGFLTLSGAPTSNLHAATKIYVDTADALKLPLTGGTVTGTLVVANASGGYGGQFTLTNSSAGATNPTKYFRVNPTGTLEIINSAFTAVEFQFTDAGDFNATGRIYASGTIFNTASGAATGAFHMAPNPAGTSYGSFWYNDGTTTHLLLTNNNDALGTANGLRPFYVDNATGIVSVGHVLFDASGSMYFKAGMGVYGKDNAGTDRLLIRRVSDICYINEQASSHCNIYAYTGYNINLNGGALLANMPAYKPGGGVWLDSSDVRLKHNIEDYTTSLDAILKLRPVSFEFNGLAETIAGPRHIGLVANEVEDVMPEMVGSWKRKLNPEDEHETDIKTLDTTALTFALVNAVKQLAARITTLEGR